MQVLTSPHLKGADSEAQRDGGTESTINCLLAPHSGGFVNHWSNVGHGHVGNSSGHGR